MSVPLPSKFKELSGEFDGTTNPIDHIHTFQDWVRLHGWPDAIACRAFPITLKKDAREWFDKLPPRSISSFSEFANKFVIWFSSSARKKKIAIRLMQLMQEKGESLREYMSRFNRATFGQSITFNDEDLEGVSFPHDDALVITDDIANFDVKHVLVDIGSTVNVPSWEAFKALKIPIDQLKSINTLLQRFGVGTVIPE
ncbi:Integrase catalytic domain-containing protein [Abeliophyllum distichum]|uniref:Integrase catalytic domain-containing protein n=1 Tax=Abeliophyllum distichum TaxID=126358 RepID=A0ABD1QDY5_9LAMI